MYLTILDDVKKMLGIEPTINHFDQELILHINSNLLAINQIGIGPSFGIMIDNKTEWTELIGDRQDLESVKTLLYLKVRIDFDPPSNSFLLDSIRKNIDELSWRLLVQKEEVIANE